MPRKNIFKEAEAAIFGKSTFVEQIEDLTNRMKYSNIPVLITGEPGTGKCAMARFIFSHSDVFKKTLKVIWLSEIPQDSLETELFGATGSPARKQFPGQIQAAHEGTVICRDIAKLPQNLQIKMLRLLEADEIAQLGGHAPARVKIRLMATTQQTLQQHVREGTFLESLYMKLSAFEVKMQPLRHRRGEIADIAAYFLQRAARAQNKQISGLSEEAMYLLERYHWPGNLRELKAEIEYAVSLTPPPATCIEVENLSVKLRYSSLEKRPAQDLSRNLFEEMKLIERQHIIEAIRVSNGNKSRAARYLGIKHRTLYQKMKNLEIPLDVQRVS